MSKAGDYITKELKGATGLTWTYNDTTRHFYSNPIDKQHLGHTALRMQEIDSSLKGKIQKTPEDAKGNRMLVITEESAKSVVINAKSARDAYRSTANAPAQGR